MKDDKIFLKHILDEIEFLQTKSDTLSYDQLISDRDIEHAITRALEIIGEASKNVSLEIREKYPSVPWKDIAGMRDRIIHGYFSINYEIVYDVVKRKIPEIEPVIRTVLSNLERET
ncbi:MAG: DUF86 domain-containing protein [Methanospirillum sp.]|uniref:HepT-like ribonuclease domain-containing protein n=1 Tax=Methanospirillum sp. TaxID=45200 RepID=UPI00236D7D91|nr:DUF86 domain-containing protein [Methanospirillum sp.]MDD1729161.1 DUF86 domain-containing protein [Methanospirillum sp.]